MFRRPAAVTSGRLGAYGQGDEQAHSPAPAPSPAVRRSTASWESPLKQRSRRDGWMVSSYPGVRGKLVVPHCFAVVRKDRNQVTDGLWQSHQSLHRFAGQLRVQSVNAAAAIIRQLLLALERDRSSFALTLSRHIDRLASEKSTSLLPDFVSTTRGTCSRALLRPHTLPRMLSAESQIFGRSLSWYAHNAIELM